MYCTAAGTATGERAAAAIALDLKLVTADERLRRMPRLQAVW